MYRIDSADSVDGRFDDGDEALGREGTVVPADWLNEVQEELGAIVEHQGGDLQKGNRRQVLDKLLWMIERAGPRTGEFALDLNPAPRDGWVFFDDGTIGPAGSGATTRENNDTKALYFVLYNNYSNSLLPVSGNGRGANAQADWDAGKTIRLPRLVGRALAVAGNGSGLTNRQAGSYTGAEKHQLDIDELPRFGLPDTKNYDGGYDSGNSRGRGGEEYTDTTYIGGNEPHNNMQPTAFVHVRVKL